MSRKERIKYKKKYADIVNDKPMIIIKQKENFKDFN